MPVRDSYCVMGGRAGTDNTRIGTDNARTRTDNARIKTDNVRTGTEIGMFGVTALHIRAGVGKNGI